MASQSKDPVKAAAGRIGAFVTLSRHDPRMQTTAARAKFLRSFEDKVDPERILAPEERQRRAKAAHREHMARMAMASAKARRARKVGHRG